MIDLSIIIVSYKVKHFLEHCISSVYQAVERLSFEIFVVDNNSQDGTEALFGQSRPHLRFIQNRGNVGFSRANNQVLSQCRGRYILLLNPDTVVQADTFARMISFMDNHSQAGLAG